MFAPPLPSPWAQTCGGSFLPWSRGRLLARWPLTSEVSLAAVAALAAVWLGARALEVDARVRVFGRDVQEVVSLNEAAFVLLLAMPPAWPWVLTLLGNVVIQAVRHPNLLCSTSPCGSVSLSVAVTVHELLTPTSGVDGLTVGHALVVGLAVLVRLAINTVAVSAVVAASQGVPLSQVQYLTLRYDAGRLSADAVGALADELRRRLTAIHRTVTV